MSDPLSKPIRRNLIEAITKDPRTIRQFEDMSLDVSENLPALIEEAAFSAENAGNLAQYGATLGQEALDSIKAFSDVSAGHLQSSIAELQKTQNDDLFGMVSQLFAEVHILKKAGGGMQIKRKFEATIDLTSVSSATYTISPVVDVDKTIIIDSGSVAGSTLNVAQFLYKLELTNSSTVTATRGASNATPFAVTFQVVEYT